MRLSQLPVQLKETSTDGYLFPRGQGDPWCFYRKAWEGAVTRAKISDFTFHDLRHSFASYLALNGASLLDIGELLGHRDLKTTKRYVHLTEGHKRAVVERMAQNVFREGS